MKRRLPVPTATAEQREILQQWTRRPKTAQALALRARIVLRLADGESSMVVARETRSHIQTVSKWRERFVARGVWAVRQAPSRAATQNHRCTN